MRSNNLQKRDFYWIGRLIGEDVYLQTLDERTAESAEKILTRLIINADKEAEESRQDDIQENTDTLEEKMEALIGSKSSDYNKGVQDCVNLCKEK